MNLLYSPSYNPWPPDTLITCPVTHRAWSEAKNRATSAISSGFPIRFRGILSLSSSSNSAQIYPVCVGPGAIVFTLIPNAPISIAILRVKASIAALLAP